MLGPCWLHNSTGHTAADCTAQHAPQYHSRMVRLSKGQREELAKAPPKDRKDIAARMARENGLGKKASDAMSACVLLDNEDE